MSNYRTAGPDKWSQTPRKVFDKYTEKIERKMRQAHDDLVHLERVLRKEVADLINLETSVEELEQLVRGMADDISQLQKKEARR